MINLKAEHILLNQTYQNAEMALQAAGDFLVANHLVTPEYTATMLARQQKASVYIGNFVALPHGDVNGSSFVLQEGICLIQVPDGVDFGNEEQTQIATILFVVALKEKQLAVLQEIAFLAADIENIMALSDAKDKQTIQTILKSN